MKVEIKHRYTGAVIFECDAKSVKGAVQKAVEKKVPLRDAGLRYANLRGADLYSANLRDANLRDAGLRGANLRDANLRGADLYSANLRDANLRDAGLRYANLRYANLRYADLYGADLCGADLCGADLYGADLCGIKINYLTTGIHSAPEGELIGWKKLVGGTIAKLRIPAEARRSCATTRKHRAEFVVVLEGKGYTVHNNIKTQYEPGATVGPDKWDENRWNACTNGIHFFLTREEAEAWE